MNKRAFLFGINEYNAPIAKLNFARQDAKAVARALIDGYGFRENEVVLVTCDTNFKPTTKFDMLGSLNWTEELDLLIVGFWGHGVWRDGNLYLCPIGTNLDFLPQTAPTLDELREAISRIPAKNVCIILDCCQSKLQTGMDATAPTFDARARDVVLSCASVATSNQTVAILNSCSEGQRAYEWDEKGHGYFTVHLLEELEKRESNVATIFKYVREETQKSSANRQSPFFKCEGGSEILLPAVPLKTFFVPENPSDVKIVTDHEIGDINVTIQRIDLPQGAQPQALPPVPEDLRQFQSELAGIDQAIQQLKNGMHPALDPAKKAISDANSQLETLKIKSESAWKLLNDKNLRQTVTEKLWKRPDTPIENYLRYAPGVEVQSLLYKAVLWELHVIQAQAECDRVADEYRAKCQVEIDKLENQKKESRKRISSRIAAFQTEVLTKVLSTFRNYDVLGIPTNNRDFQWDCGDKLPELLKYDLGWEFQQLLKRAKELWKNNRPVVVRERERKEREREERERKEREREERERERKEREREERERKEREREARERIEREEQAERDRIARRKAKAKRRAMMREWAIGGICVGIIVWGTVLSTVFLGIGYTMFLLGILLAVIVINAIIRGKKERIAAEEKAEAERILVAIELQKKTARNGKIRMVKTIDDVEYAFRWCPAGSFQMGSQKGYDDEKPVHTVSISEGFWMLETEVTQKMWESVMGENPSEFKGAKLPVERIDWDKCQDFCEKLRSKGLEVSLPTEAQWEYACRAGTTGDYAGNLDEMAWYSSNSRSKTHEVGLKKPNAWGLYDMNGNVWEWCLDWYDDGYYSVSPASDPTGPEIGFDRINRGGSCLSVAVCCRSANRDYDSPDYQNNCLGVRLVLAVSGLGK